MTKFDAFLENMSAKTIDIIGIGVSNTPLIKLLAKNGAKVSAFDKNKNIDKSQFEGLDITFYLGDDYLTHLSSEIIFRTPGMHPNNEFLVKAQQNGSQITSEMEIFFDVCPCPIIAITGSDGKTTTTTLTYEIIKNDGYICHLGGNIGHPLLCDVPNMKVSDFCVVELSSFQLQTMKSRPDVAVITNITPNHLDIHKDMAEYIDAKKNVFLYQNPSDMLVSNLDDSESSDYKANGTQMYFSMSKHNKNGAYLDGDSVVLNTGNTSEILMKKQDILLPGEHNVANYLAAICATHKYVDTSKIIDVAKRFGGVAHRIEFVREHLGVKYYNDSIATSPTRAIAGLKSFDQKIILIAGGYDKNLDFAPLAPIIAKHVKKLVLVGKTAEKIKIATESVPNDVEIFMCESFEQAVNKSREISESGDIVSLSPASASFDLFKNFEERGNLFKKIVNDWR